MITRTYSLKFLTPAFMGNAEQAGQWRTPPIKALLRQWWRVAYAADHPKGLSVEAMRQAEGLLFGHAWLKNDCDERGNKVAARRSEIRLRLSDWSIGDLSADRWTALPTVRHPEVPRPVPADLYLGYGPVTLPRGQASPTLKARAAIQAGKAAELRLAAPDGEATRLQRALALLNLYGTLGGRSRNGWGSFSLQPLDGTEALASTLDMSFTLPWRDALASDWPQAIGTDEDGPLIWHTEALSDWRQAMRRLAEIKIGLRTQFRFTTGREAQRPEDRHWLSYPVTNHSVRDWGNNARLPNTLRFKVRPTADGKLCGVIFHVPCKPPPAFGSNTATLERVWHHVHEHLDASLKRIPA